MNSWVTIRINSLGAIFAAALAAYLVYGKAVTASNTGFSLNMAGQHTVCYVVVIAVDMGTVGFSSMILWWVRIFNELEVSGTPLSPHSQYP